MDPGLALTRRERRILAAAGDALLPAGDRPSLSASAAGVPDEAARLLASQVVRPVALVYRVLLWALELAPLVTRRRTFTRLDEPTREDVLRRAGASRIPARNQLVSALKHLLVNIYLTVPRVASEFGYDRELNLARCRTAGAVTGPSLHPLVGAEVPRRIACDAVVVGSGAGGAAAAAVLAEGGLDVVVVEEGGHHPRETLEEQPPFHRLVALYRDLSMTGTVGWPPIPVPLGRAVGGTTLVNAGTCFRTPDAVLEMWRREFALDDVSPEALGPLFEEVEEVQGVRAPPAAVLGRNAAVTDAGSRALGAVGAPLCRNVRGCRGCGESVTGCPFDAKQAVTLTWLPRAEAAGATILARVRVDRVLHAEGRVRGVEGAVLEPGPLDLERHRVRIDADHVIVAAGAFHTPALLARSRVPDPSGQRGRNLQIHPAIGVAAEMPHDVRAWEGVNQSWAVDALVAEHGIMIEATAAPPAVTGGQMPFVGRPLKELVAMGARMATCGFLIEDSTSGRLVRLPGGRVAAAYQLTRHDRRRIAVGFAWLAEMFLAAGARRVLVARPDRPWASTTADVRRIRAEGVPAEALKLSAYHPVGTHRVSGDPALGPCDEWGRVRGTEALWVSDASLLPTCTGVNPQVTIMAFALRAARQLLRTA